jgi:hypothetical protein
MNVETRAIKGHFGFDSKRALRVSMDNMLELELAIEHGEKVTHIALDPQEAAALRDLLDEWLERGRRPPLSAERH